MRIHTMLLGFPCLLLLACQSSNTVTYRLDIDTENSQQRTELAMAANRVVERRLQAMGEQPEDLRIERLNGAYVLTAELSDPEIVDILTEKLQEPFSFRIMKLVPVDQAEIIIAEIEGYNPTGITTEHLQSMKAEEMEDGTGRVTVNLTPDGRELMAKVFQENIGEYLGLFVRNIPVYKMLVETDELLDSIVITDIPVPELGATVADDANVGLHVSFEPVE